MNQLATLEVAANQLRGVVATLEDSEMDTVTSCEPWTVRQLASHAVNSQLLWVGVLTGEELVSIADTMGAVPYEGDLAPISNDAIDRSLAAWGAEGVLDATHTTPFGELPGSAVINFVIIDAFAHAWDISTALGRPIEFPAEAIPAISEVVAASCTEGTQSMGLFGAPTGLPADATETERLMAATGRVVSR
jgi:uncharacterized protein (TIGR03086 family)